MNEFIEADITVGKLRELYKSGEFDIEIDSFDGYQPIVSWWDKGILPMVYLETINGKSTRCAANHLLQSADGNWLLSNEIDIGTELLTSDGISPVSMIEFRPDEECYDFEVGHENHRYWGDGISSHNSGKSYIVSANIVKAAQQKGVYVVLIDTETSLDESWMRALDVNTDDSVLTKISGATVDDVSKLLSEVIENYKTENSAVPYDDRPKLLLIIDSLGMLITPTMEAQYDAGENKGDMGIKAKQITAMIRVTMAKIASQPIGLLVTNHVYDSQDKYKPDTIPGGKMLEFASSIIVQMNKLLLKEDENGKKLEGGEVAGIKASIVTRKSRYAKPFEKLQIHIPYTTGMDPYSGLFDLIEKKGLINKEGNSYVYTSPVTGEVFKKKKSNFKSSGLFDQIMEEWSHWDTDPKPPGFDDTVDPEAPTIGDE